MTKDHAPYIPLHFRSYFSLLEGVLSPEEICVHVKKNGYAACGIQDVNNLYGFMRFVRACENEGIKPVAGAEIRVRDTSVCTAFVMNEKGFARLCRMLTKLLASANPYKRPNEREEYDPVIDFVQNGWDGLAIASSDTGVLDRLAHRQRERLYAKLVYGKAYRQIALRARDAGIGLLAVNEASVIDPADAKTCDLLRAIDLNTTTSSLEEKERFSPLRIACTQDDMERFFSAVPDALANTRVIADESSVDSIAKRDYVFPRFRGMNEEEAFRALKRLCVEGIARRYGSSRQDIEKRLDYELSIIGKKGFTSYFLVVHDIVSRCPRTCGRGSAASSIVSYLLGITHVDPLAHNLFFERFLNEWRSDPPDIDVDFPWDERDGVLRYVFETYEGRAGMVANHVTFGRRSSFREPAKAFGIPEEEIKRMERLVALGREDEIPGYIRKAASRIRGLPRYIGLHCGGVVVTPGPITDYTHVQPSIMGYPVIAWEKEGTEEAGLVKIDLLGNRSLAVLRDTMRLVEERKGLALSWESFNPVNNHRVRELIRTGKTVGIFYVESPATRQLLKKMKTGDFGHLVIASSIIRPAANKYIREYVRRLRGGDYTPLHASVEKTLAETCGIMVYQEDVSRVAIDLAGFGIAEADRLRKIVTKKSRGSKFNDYRDLFFEKGAVRGVPRSVLDEAWDMILSFSGYSFCKAHSASYALVSMRLAFFKAYYPLEFLASVINNGGGFYTRQTYLNEVKRMGFEILRPDVTRSAKEFTIEDREGSEPALRTGLSQIKELDAGFMELCIEERNKAQFADFFDFVKRTKPGLPQVRILVRSGALDSLEPRVPRPQMFWLYFHREEFESLFFLPELPAFVGDYPERVKLGDEIATTGILYSSHPLTVFSARIRSMLSKGRFPPVITSRDMDRSVGKRVTIAGLIVTGKEVATKKNETMIFVSFEDPHSIFETVFFPAAFRKFGHLLDEVGVYLIVGKVEEEYGAVSIDVEDLSRVNREKVH